jgi:hypothetical protein
MNNTFNSVIILKGKRTGIRIVLFFKSVDVAKIKIVMVESTKEDN